MSTFPDDSIYVYGKTQKEWNFLYEQVKARARRQAGVIVEASVKKDYFLLKTKAQMSINAENVNRKSNLMVSKIALKQLLQGRAGDAALAQLDAMKKREYYNDGADSIQP